MKKKWPKFLTFKRTVLILIVLIAGAVLTSYFLGGYVGVTASYDTRDFSLEGFVPYTEYEAKAKEEVTILPYEEDDTFAQKVEKCNYREQLQVVVNAINAEVKDLKANGGDPQEIADLEALAKDAQMSITLRKLPSLEEYTAIYVEEALGFGSEPLMETGSYEFWFNKKWTTFKVVEKRTGNEWYSNPEAGEDDKAINANTLRQQQSLINISYAGLLGATSEWDSYNYSIADIDITGEEQLTPNFQIKEIKDDSGKVTALQVYYFFARRGIDYSYFPEKFSHERICSIQELDITVDETLPDLLKRNKEGSTDGEWEVITSLAEMGEDGATASDHSVWFKGEGAPADSLGEVGSFYIDTENSVMYAKTTETVRKGSKYTEETEWREINTELLTWDAYVLSNVSEDTLYDYSPKYSHDYAYFGTGAPVATDGINGFYYCDTATGTVYKKANGTIPYTHVIAAKEVQYWTTQYYKVEKAEISTNTYGYDYYYYSNTHQNMSLTHRNKLYAFFYEKCLYTEYDLMEDNTEFGAETSSSNAKFGVAIEYALTDAGLKVTVLDESIQEMEEYPVTAITVLPYFTASHSSVDGYMVIPDGSGAVMNYNNGKTSYTQYAKTVYSTDLTKMDEIKITETEDLVFAMFAMVNTNIPGNEGVKSGVLVDVEQGGSQLRLSANISGITDSYNKIYYSAFYRESQKTTIGVGYYATTFTKWTETRTHSDIVFNYCFLGDEELNYASIAKKYREILVDRYGLESKDTTDETVLNVSLVGAYDFRNNFLGIGYRDYGSMTTFSQAEEILKDLKAHGANHINAYYLGWRNKGLIDTSFESFKVSKELGGKSDLEDLVDYTKSNDIELYLDLNFGELNKFQESYGKSRYSSRDVSGSYVEKYPYDLSSGMYDKKQDAIYVLSPRFYGVFMESLVESYTDDIGLTNLSLKNLGSALASDYKRYNEFFKENSLQESIKALEYATSNGIDNLSLYAPYDFAFKYTSNALEVPYVATQYEVLDYSVPFYQLVVSGLFDYSGEVINAHDEKGNQWHIMHILETGSNVSFTFSFEDSTKLIQTDYKYYYYTEYSKWTNDVKEVVSTIDEIGIHECELTDHKLIANNIYEVTYTGNGTTINIVLNYSDSDVVVNGINVEARGYVYNKNNSGWRE